MVEMFIFKEEKKDENLFGLNYTYADIKGRTIFKEKSMWFGKHLVTFNSGLFLDMKIPDSVLEMVENYTNIPDIILSGYFGGGGRELYKGKTYAPAYVAILQAYFMFNLISKAYVKETNYYKSDSDLAWGIRVFDDAAPILNFANMMTGINSYALYNKFDSNFIKKAFRYFEDTLMPKLAKQDFKGVIGNPYESFVKLMKQLTDARKDMLALWKNAAAKGRNSYDRMDGGQRLSGFLLYYLYKVLRGPVSVKIRPNDPTFLPALTMIFALMTYDCAKEDIKAKLDEDLVDEFGAKALDEKELGQKYQYAEDSQVIMEDEQMIFESNDPEFEFLI